MSIRQIPMPKIVRSVPAAKESRYTAIFAGLEAGSDACHVEEDFIDAKKAVNKLHGAVAAYRERTGDKSAFSVRVIEDGGVQIVAVWKLAKDFTPRKPKAA